MLSYMHEKTCKSIKKSPLCTNLCTEGTILIIVFFTVSLLTHVDVSAAGYVSVVTASVDVTCDVGAFNLEGQVFGYGFTFALCESGSNVGNFGGNQSVIDGL